MHYIGMDCHISTLDFAVVDETGRLVKAKSVTTSVNLDYIPPKNLFGQQVGSNLVKILHLESWILFSG